MAKKLYRSTTDRWVAGICSGIGEYLEIDPNVIRAIWVIITAHGVPTRDYRLYPALDHPAGAGAGTPGWNDG